ncbi:thymidine phosphorylase [Anaeroselena agilis]|uniref:Pyrimidine-nucleoside phosphorylase n=1 Tax=Anaeroselena agilis TaxID=3063788 RepID=A0ABU3NW98_9FIRM|nr:thymidine phosphorylase [Selenomonadales bacterium 4137-cl]
MRIVDTILDKRDGRELSAAVINELIASYTAGEIPDYQMAAFLMAVYFRGMTAAETAALTLAMAKSGATVDLGAVPGVKVDKHSTGGVADTTTLVLAPLVAAAGVPVAKMSGRGLGFTGGTIDKLEAIPGFRTALSSEEFLANLGRIGVAITGQTADIAPADGKLYALRDVTATIESIPLIASSVMSKKIAAGADKILLDVKTGSGAFMKTPEQAFKLAETMVGIGTLVGRETMAVISTMHEPLGLAVGNSLEVAEAIDILSGAGGAPELREICLTLGAHMLVMAGKAADFAAGYRKLQELLDGKEALAKFAALVAAQGGNPDVVANRALLPLAAIRHIVASPAGGFVQSVDAARIGYAAMILGAGREYKGQQIDLGAGLVMHCRLGDKLALGQPLATLYTADPTKIPSAEAAISAAITIGPDKAARPELILGTVTAAGINMV